MTIDTNELRRLAQAATPGPWKMLPVGDGRQKFAVADSEFRSILTVTDEGEATFGTVYDDADAKFIAAANPAAISEILGRLEAAEKEIESIRQGTTFRDDVVAALAMERDALQAKIEAMGRPGAEWFDWLPQGTTHISSIRLVTIPCFGLEARFNAFKHIDGVLYTYRTDSDNEYGKWVKADSMYRNGVLPTVYPLSGAQGEEK